MKKLLILISLFSINLNSQNEVYPWQVNLGANAIIYRKPIDIFDNLTDSKNVNMGGQFSVSRHIIKGFSTDLSFLISNGYYITGVKKAQHLMANGMFNIKYSFANGYILPFNSRLEPFVKFGIGQTYHNITGDKFFTTFSAAGLGASYWLGTNRKIGIQLQHMYHFIPSVAFNREEYFSYTGSVSYRFGIQDKDKDGVSDKNDLCPEEFGKPTLNGCPDSDDDNIIDKSDKCPFHLGLAKYEGCPDNDGDEIPDNLDQCPNAKGNNSSKGCPDADGDGLSDIEDGCPYLKGSIATNGCSDSDGDEVADNIDNCPNVKGLLEFNGCLDSDGDNISDFIDICPDKIGSEQYKGCPDTDGDNIPDNEDKCPNTAGSKNYSGCPYILVENKGTLVKQEEGTNTTNSSNTTNYTTTNTNNTTKTTTSTSNNTSTKNNVDYNINLLFQVRTIYFDSDKTEIFEAAKPILNEIFEVFKMNNYENVFIVEGHADNSGEMTRNIELSKLRALSVKNYLIKKGMPSNKLQTIGSGTQFPIGDNNKVEGRALNRRVDVYLK